MPRCSKPYHVIVLLCLSYSVLTTTAMAEDTSTKHASTFTMTCPPVKSLVKDKSTNLWASPDASFKSFNSSFVDSLDSFVGAQWGGAGLGQIFCVYVNSRDKLSLPAVLAYNVVAVEPTQSDDLSWEAKQGQTMNCHSTDTSKCAFQVRTKPKEESLSDVFDAIKPNTLDNNS